MALTLNSEYEIVNVGTGIIYRDITTYGGANYDRNEVKVNFVATDRRTGQVIDFAYDEDTATEVLIPIAHDGWYNVVMTVSNTGDEYSDEKVTNILVTERFCDCIANYSTKLLKKVCGCEDAKTWQKLFCMQGQLMGIAYLVEKNDMLSADMAIERLNLECKRLNEDCGC